MSQIIGKVGMTPRGMYDRTRAYERLDVVTYQGSSWVAIVDVPAQISPAMGSDYWQLVARMGETGPQGPVGPQGNSAFMNDGTVNKYELVNNLTQGGENAVLSAEQGKILKQELTELESEVQNTESRVNASQKALESRVNAEIENFKDAVTDQVESYKPIVINGNVTNAADEEDITSENNLLKLKDRSALNGMGYVILRKNKAFAEQVTKANTIYEIRYDFNLAGGEVEIPEGSVLDFKGGSVSNGTIVFNNNYIESNLTCIFKESLEVTGTITNTNIFPEWFGEYGLEKAVEFYYSITDYFLPTNKVIKLSGKIYDTSKSLIIRKPIHIEGEGWNTVVRYNGTENITSVFELTYNSDVQISAPYTTFSKFRIHGSKLAESAIYGNRVSACTMSWLRMEGYKIAIDIGSGWNNKILYCILNSNDIAINTHSDSNNVLIIDGCSINSNKLGCYITAGKSINITNTAFEANGAAIYINYLANTVNVDRCYFERNGIEDFVCVDQVFKSDIIINGSSSKYEFEHSHMCSNINIQNCSIQNMYNQAFVSVSAVSGLKVNNNCLTKLKWIPYNVIQLYPINYAKSTDVKAFCNIGFDETFTIYGEFDGTYNQVFYKWVTDAVEPRNYAVEDIRNWIIESSVGGMWARPRGEHIDDNWLVSSLFIPKNNTTDMVYFELDIDQHQELSGKLLNFGFYEKGTNTVPTIDLKVITDDKTYSRTYPLSANYTRREIYFVAPTVGKVKLGFKCSYTANVDVSAFIGKVFLCVVGADTTKLNYRFVKSPTNTVSFRGEMANILTSQYCKLSDLPTLTSYDEGEIVYVSDLNKPAWWDGTKWVDSNNNAISCKTSGTFTEKPFKPTIGFSYYCTDRKHSDDSVNGIMIFHRGNDVWIDAFGNTIT